MNDVKRATTGNNVVVGYLPDFHYGSEPAIVLLGDEVALIAFSDWLRQLGARENYSVRFNDIPLFVPVQGVVVWLHIAPSALGMIRSKAGSGHEFNWTISPRIAKTFADLVRDVAVSAGPGHQYLEVEDRDDVVVVVSKGEYTTKLFEK